MGLLSSTRRPIGATIRSITRITSLLSWKRTSVRSRMPARSTNTCRGPLTRISVTLSSRRNCSSGPNPRMSATICSNISLRSLRDSGSPVSIRVS